MKLNYYLVIISCGVAIFAFGDPLDSVQDEAFQSRTLASMLSPLGMVKAARRLVTNGAQIFRERIQEGVKVAQSVKENDDKGSTRLMTKESSSGSESKDFIEIARDGVLGGIFRFMGMDSSSIGMVVLNVLIFFAEMLTTSILGKDVSNVVETRMIKDNLFEWVMTGRNQKVDQILRDARDKHLPDSIISILQRKTGNQTACVQLLICKMSPFIWGVQKRVDEGLDTNRNETKYEGIASRFLNFNVWEELFTIFPDRNRFISFGDNCEKRFPNCKLLKFSQKGDLNKRFKT